MGSKRGDSRRSAPGSGIGLPVSPDRATRIAGELTGIEGARVNPADPVRTLLDTGAIPVRAMERERLSRWFKHGGWAEVHRREVMSLPAESRD
jgi:hypothetical protein